MLFSREAFMVRRWIVVAGAVVMLAAPGMAHGQAQPPRVALAYVAQDTVTLADADGNAVAQTGPTFVYGQGARLFWTPDGDLLYIARDDGLYAASAEGGPAVKVPGGYGRTLTIAQDAETLYYVETMSPQPVDANVENGPVTYPLREVAMALMDGSAGRLAGYFGRFQAGAAQASITFAAALYARDGGLLGPGRPNIWPTYGSNVFGTCCFPDPGLGTLDVSTGDFSIYDPDFIPGGAAVNLTRTHLAGPTTGGAIRVIDLITGGTRDYVIEIAGGLGTIERVAWSPDDTYLYFIARYDPDHPLVLEYQPSFPVDPSSANVHLFRLNLVTSVIRDLAWRADVYGISSLAATDRYVFAVVVDPNTQLVDDLNRRRVRPGSQPTDPEMAAYMPQTHLWRVDIDGASSEDVAVGVWGLAARPIR
jgi:hypothetical protein